MNLRAAAYQEFNQAAIIDKLITGLPSGESAGGAAGQRRQDHNCVDRQRRYAG